MIIDKKTLEHLAGLSRIELDPEKEEKLVKDLASILGHFEDLGRVDTEGIEPMAGGTTLKSIFREDDSVVRLDNKKALGSFPEEEGGLLKVPPVFE